ncbi:hypothetical protein [Longimicrobium sp.]|uniref:hypothetical protein n=1 Tax=Longimicrobium sp. TaxID=2029185 RepID=UPI002ED94FBD
MHRLFRAALLCAAGAAALACGGGDTQAYATHAEAARALALPPYVPGTAHTFTAVAEEGGARWMRFQVPPADAQRMVEGMRVLTFGQARTGRFTPPSWKGDWPPELSRREPTSSRSSLRFYAASPIECLAVEWVSSVAYLYPCGGG